MNDAQTPLANDLMTGLAEIANYLGWSLRTTKHRNEMGELPTFKIGNGRTVYARRSTLAKHIAAQEAAHFEKAAK